jgi:hypothetical protein
MEMKVKEAPDCPHCQHKMKKMSAIGPNYGDGLGWGVPFLYVCFNDECKLFVDGWRHIKENFGKVASYRCMCYPDNGKMDTMCVFTPDGCTGQIIEE